MAFGTQDAALDDDTPVMNEINMTPLVDVMLVLLIIFIITVPVMKHAVQIELPSATAKRQSIKPESIALSVDAHGAYFWNMKPVSVQELSRLLEIESAKEPQVELHIRGDKSVRYEFVAQAMAAAKQAGIRRIGFVTEPKK
jgi:biopolymer transport protein ExbD